MTSSVPSDSLETMTTSSVPGDSRETMTTSLVPSGSLPLPFPAAVRSDLLADWESIQLSMALDGGGAGVGAGSPSSATSYCGS